ncbi:23543_t:CDS:2, partial [Gigaspora margarita]
MKKAKKVHNKTTDLVSRYQEQNLESRQSGSTNTICTITAVDELTTDNIQTTTNMRKNNKSSIEDPILEAKAKTDKSETTTNIRTNEETYTEIEIEESEKEGPDHKKQQQELLESSTKEGYGSSSNERLQPRMWNTKGFKLFRNFEQASIYSVVKYS